ncbi:MAG TPA: carboxypeptidase-like regulatory domain-containing protein, partial [Vicinamibacterales bacterium]|nr:carboxypeptidase-like regulatory domain-containing protein [Vicinamibacterales bacterium]
VVTITGGGLAGNVSAVSDDSGRFRFVDLAPGRYTVAVSKPAYLPMVYGATRPGRPGTAIAVSAGQTVNVRVPLSRGAVITGTIRDQFGQPMAGMPVTVSRAEDVTALSGGILLTPNEVVTDDRGVYRAFGLTPGEYVVSTTQRNATGGDTQRMTQTAIDARTRTLEQRFGARAPAASSAGAPPAASAPPTVTADPATSTTRGWGFAPVFFPGTPIAAEASRVRVAAGEERTAVDIAYVPVRTARVSGVIHGSATVPMTRLLPNLTARGPSQSTNTAPPATPAAADGSFSFSNVSPGTYSLLVRSGDGASMRTADGRGASTGNPGIPSLFAQVDLDVNGADIGGLVLTLRPAPSISGRVVFDATTLTAPASLQGIRVSVVVPGAQRSSPTIDLLGAGRLPVTTVNADGAFELVGIIPGTYTLSSSAPGNVAGSTWWLRSAILDGRDLLDQPLVVDAGSSDFANVVLTFSDRHSGITGTLTTAAAQPASEFTVVAFPTDRALWRPGARRIKLTRPGSDGAFMLTDLPAGEYYLAALVDVEATDLQQSAFLESLIGASAKITIAEGQQARQDLRIAK